MMHSNYKQKKKQTNKQKREEKKKIKLHDSITVRCNIFGLIK